MHALVLTLFISFSLASVTVETPFNVVACEETQLFWAGGIDPWTLRIVSASPPNQTLDEMTARTVPFNWVADPHSDGIPVIFQVQDSTGDLGQSSSFFIAPPRDKLLCGGPKQIDSSTLPAPTVVNVNPVEGGGGPPGPDPSTGSGEPDPTGSPSSGSGGDGEGPASSSQDAPPPTQGGPGSPPPTTESSPTGIGLSPSGPSVTPTSASPATLAPNSLAQSVPTANSDPGVFPSTDPAAAQGSPALSSADLTGGAAGQQQPAITLFSSGGDFTSLGAAGLPGQTAGSNNLTQKKAVMSGPIVGGIVAAALCVTLAAFCVILRCRRRRQRQPETTLYPFTAESSEHSTARVTTGRTGYPPSAFSSWGNNGDLADEYARSPTEQGAPVFIPDSTEEHGHSQPAWGKPAWGGQPARGGQPAWGSGQGQSPGPVESSYAAFTPRHNGASSSIDRNDPTSHQRFRGPVPKAMIDAYRAGPSNAPRDQGYGSPRTNGGTPVTPGFGEATSSWREGRELIVGSRQPIVGVPPPYTDT